MYFRSFPTIFYNFDVNGERQLRAVTDITANVRVRKAVLEQVTLYDEYDIQEGETPEIISAKVYGSPHYHWVIMMINERYDALRDFPMSQYTLDRYIDEEYPNSRYQIHHYEDATGNTVNSDYPNAIGITNEAYEYRLNESKRRIKIIAPEYLARLTSQLNALV